MDLELPTVAGNHERQLLTYAPERMGVSDRLAHDSIADRHREWMAGLPLTLQVTEGVLAFHGSPTDDLVYLLETVDPSGARPATEAEVVERLGAAVDVPLLLCGHTHLQRSMRLATGSLVLNPGSVGWPAYDDFHPYPHVMEAGTPHARYAIADDASGQWQAEFRTVVYDWDKAAEIAEGNGRPDVVTALRTGRV
jgi:hypothetical protein